MKEVNKLMNVKELAATMQQMEREMIEMGLKEEMVNEAIENMNEEIDLGDLQASADNLIFELEQRLNPMRNQL